mgnify:CR=1 FL=1
MIKTELFNECMHSSEEDLTCPFAEQQNEKILCSQTLGFYKEAINVVDLKKCFMTAAPRDKVSMINKISK